MWTSESEELRKASTDKTRTKKAARSEPGALPKTGLIPTFALKGLEWAD